jgi:DNA (cytosine-5)-methyltransferase 1
MLKFTDFFSGIGGFHLAMEKATDSDCELIGYAEIEPVCNRIYERAFDPNARLPNGDIRGLVSGDSDEWGVPQFDICLGGFPCQPFSNVGKRKGLDDKRSNVFFDLLRALEYYQPNYFVLENVEKIKTLEKGAVLAMLAKELESLGYKIDIQLLCAKDYGLPQQRKRIFLCGRKKKTGKTFPDLPNPKPVSLPDSLYPSSWHLLERSMPTKHIVPAGSRKTIFTRNEKWMGDLEIDRAIARPICATMGKWHRANQDNYYTEHFVLSEGGIKPPSFDYLQDAVRRLTPLEALRLQGFPDSFYKHYADLGIAVTPAYQTIGNAVPVDLAAAVISNLLERD